MAATVFARERASGPDRCAYSGGPAPEVRGRLFLPIAGPWWLEGWSAGRRRCDGWAACASAPLMVGAYGVDGDMSLRAGTFDAVGDGNPVPERVGCPRLERIAPRRAECPPPASGMRSLRVAAEACNRHQSRRCTEGCRSGVRLEDVGRERSRSTQKTHGDKPDLFLVHLRSVQGSGILCGNRSTSYSRRRIPDRPGRPSVAVHQSNRQGRSRAPSSGQVRDDVSRGDQGAPGR